MVKIFLLFWLVVLGDAGTIYSHITSSKEKSDENSNLNWHKYISQVPTVKGPIKVEVRLAYFADNQVIGISVNNVGSQNGSLSLMDFNSGFAATVNQDRSACLVTRLPDILDYESHKETLEVALSSNDHELPSLYCEYDLAKNDLSVYGEWIDSFCFDSDEIIIQFKDCYPMDDQIIKNNPSAAMMALEKSCLVIAYVIDYEEEGHLACIRGGYSSDEKFFSPFPTGNDDVDDPNGFFFGFIHDYLTLDYLSGHVMIVSDASSLPYQGSIFVELSKGISGMIRYDEDDLHECALVTFESGKTMMDFVGEFDNPEYGTGFYKCKSSNIDDLAVFHSELVMNLCQDRKSYLLENCTGQPQEDDDPQCEFMGVIYENKRARLSCVVQESE